MRASALTGAAAPLLHLIFPRTCAACRCAVVERGAGLCPTCSADLALHVDGEYCRRCARDVGPHLLHDGRCTECAQQRRPPLSRIARVGRHRGALRGLVLAFKHERVHDAVLGGLLAAVWRRELAAAGVDAIVPIPSPWLRRWRRGFHPTALLARYVARSAGVPCRRWLTMARPVRPQTGLSAALRERNIRGAFKCVRAAPIHDRTIGLIDDVSTTGATLREAARTLRAAGARDVFAAVVSRAVLVETPDA
jgi:ComF family protein